MKIKFILLSLLFIFYGVNAADLCQVKIDKNKKEKRIVLLMGDNAWNLFDSYVNQLKQSVGDVKLRDITVKVWDGKDFKEYSLNVWSMLTGEGDTKLWQDRLKKVNALYDEKALAKAYNLNWDIYCISPNVKPSSTSGNQTTHNKIGECNVEAKNHINLGIQFINNKDYDNAVKEFKNAVDKSKECPLAYANLINAYLLKKNYNFAIDTYKEGVKNAGNDGFLHISGAIAYVKKGDYDYALTALNNALVAGFKDVDTIKNTPELRTLLNKKKKDFCEIMIKYNLPLKECL